MLRRLVTGDWQLQDGPRDRYRTDFVFKTLPGLINKYKVDQLIVAGDICEEKDRHPAPLVNDVVSCFSALAGMCEIIILQGNHDHVHKTSPYFQFLSCFDNIYWISVPTVRDNCLYLPHTRDHKKDWKGLQFDGHDFIFAHNIFSGVKANGQSLSGIPLSIFPSDAFCISGDVHEPQTLGQVHYVGSPCLCSFGDSYQPRVFLLDGLDVKSIKVSGPQKRLIWCGVNKIAGVRELVFDHDANADDIVKIKVALVMEDVAQWPEIRQEVEHWAIKNKFVINSIVPEVEYVVGERAKVIKGDKKTDTQFLDAFVKRSGADEKTAAVGLEIIEFS